MENARKYFRHANNTTYCTLNKFTKTLTKTEHCQETFMSESIFMKFLTKTFTDSILERPLRIVYKVQKSSFNEIPEKDDSCKIYEKYLQKLEKENFKVKNESSPRNYKCF